MIIAIIAMAERPRSRRKAAVKCNRKLKSPTESSYQLLQADIPLINEAYQSQYAPNPQIGDDETGQVILASLPFPDNNGDFKTYTMFANEEETIYVVKSTNLMADDPAYYNHIKGKQEKYEFVKDAMTAYGNINKGKKKEKKSKKDVAKGVKGRVCSYRSYFSLYFFLFTYDLKINRIFIEINVNKFYII